MGYSGIQAVQGTAWLIRLDARDSFPLPLIFLVQTITIFLRKVLPAALHFFRADSDWHSAVASALFR